MDEDFIGIPDGDFNDGYSCLMKAIEDIHNNPELPLSVTDHMYLRALVSGLTNRRDYAQYDTLHHFPGDNPLPHAKDCPYRIIYDNLHNYLADHLDKVAQRIMSRDTDTWLDVYLDEWDLYNKAAARIDHVLNQVNTAWVEDYIVGGIRERFPIHTLHCVQWKKHVWSRVDYEIVDGVQKAMQDNCEYASHVRRFMNKSASRSVGQKWNEMDETSKIYECLEAPFDSMIKAHDRRVNTFIKYRNMLRIVNRGRHNRR